MYPRTYVVRAYATRRIKPIPMTITPMTASLSSLTAREKYVRIKPIAKIARLDQKTMSQSTIVLLICEAELDGF